MKKLAVIALIVAGWFLILTGCITVDRTQKLNEIYNVISGIDSVLEKKKQGQQFRESIPYSLFDQAMSEGDHSGPGFWKNDPFMEELSERYGDRPKTLKELQEMYKKELEKFNKVRLEMEKSTK